MARKIVKIGKPKRIKLQLKLPSKSPDKLPNTPKSRSISENLLLDLYKEGNENIRDVLSSQYPDFEFKIGLASLDGKDGREITVEKLRIALSEEYTGTEFYDTFALRTSGNFTGKGLFLTTDDIFRIVKDDQGAYVLIVDKQYISI